MKKAIFVEIPLTGCIEQAPENLSVRLQCTEISGGRLGFVFDLLENGDTALSAGLLAAECLFISIYLLKVTGRKPSFQVAAELGKAWMTQLSTRLYGAKGGTNANAQIWVETGAIWVGYGVDRKRVARAKLEQAQLDGLTRMADAMDTVFGK